MIELKPCPFCGGKAQLVIDPYECGDTTHWHNIICENVFKCGAQMGESISYWQSDYEEAVDRLRMRWNKRC